MGKQGYIRRIVSTGDWRADRELIKEATDDVIAHNGGLLIFGAGVWPSESGKAVKLEADLSIRGAPRG